MNDLRAAQQGAAELRLVAGSLAGTTVQLAGESLTLGRHPENNLRFSPDADLAISARHAVLLRSRAGWTLRDLGSRNGSYVNGKRIVTEVLLRSGDRLGFGAPEPMALFYDPAPALQHTRTSRHPVLRLAIVAIAAVTVGLGAAALYGMRQSSAWQQERAQLQARIDSLRYADEQEAGARAGEISGLADALRASQDEVRAIRAELARARERLAPAELGRIEKKLQSASTTLVEQQRAAALDIASITRKNRAAVALVYVEAGDGEVQTGTAFAVRADATLLTNRHVLTGADGTLAPRRIAVQFSHSPQKWPARIVGVAKDADLALLKIDNIIGDVPVAQPFNPRADTLPAGAPVALIGFPLGGEGGGEQRDGLARPLVTAATLAAVGERRIALRGYGASGASGSPIFDAEGRIIAVLYAGRGAAAGQELFAVPAAAAMRLIETLSSR